MSRGILLPVALTITFFLLAVAMHVSFGTFHSEFGRYQDEGMHYVTGLMIRDFLASPAHWSQPMAFAMDYYAHFPKVGLGNWPPLFPLLQALWSFAFGVSRVSMLVGIELLVGILAACVFFQSARRTNFWCATAAAILLVLSPLTQYVSSMVMAEAPLALFSLLAILSWIRFNEAVDAGESQATSYGIEFGCWTLAAIMTKGNAWAVPLTVGVSFLLGRQWKLLHKSGLWIAILIVAAVSIPYTVATMHIAVQGWNSRTIPDLPFLIASFGKHTRFAVESVGWPLTAVCLVGAAARVRWRDRFWMTLAIYAVIILIFHSAVPTSIEPRKVYQIVPVMCIFAAAGMDAIAHLLTRTGLKTAFAAPVAACICLAFFVISGFSILPPYAPGFGPAVESVLKHPDTRAAAILISSNPFFEDTEAAIISEWASRSRNQGTYLLRGTKILSHDANFVPVAQEGQPMRALLAEIPVSYVILDTIAAPHSYPHHDMLRKTLANDPLDWECIHVSSRMALGLPHTIEVYRSRHDFFGIPVHFEVDLKNKISRTQ